MNGDVKFVANTSSDMNCFPATICMMLSAILPERDFSLSEIIQMSGTRPSMSVWPARTLLELEKLGVDAVMIEGFDGEKFVEQGAEYLRNEFGKETSDWQIAHSDIEKERRDYKELLNSGVDVQRRIPTMNDIKHYLNNGWMVKCTVNSRRLSGKEGYVDHSVLILSLDDNEVVLHNPGLPPVQYQHVALDDFKAAWAYPNDAAKEMIALRKRAE